MGNEHLDPETRIVVIGAGVVGIALADDLVRVHGMRSVTVVDQGPLWTTGGASSHAPGFAFQTTGSEVMSELARRTLNKLDGVTLDGEWVMKRVGGLEIASTQERLDYLKRRYDLAQSWGIPSELVAPERCAELFPGLDSSAVLGGLHTPTDGAVKSERAVEVQGRRAIEHGAKVYGLTEVTDVRVEDGAVRGVEVRAVPPVRGIRSRGDSLPEGVTFIPADVVIVCTGMWGPRIGERFGLELPMVPMEHCESWTSALPDGGLDDSVEVELPILRYQEAGLYLRQYGAGYIWGSYEHRVIPVEQSQIADPEEFARTGVHPAIHPVTREDLEFTWAAVNRVLPASREVDHVGGMNGIFSFTPDGNPLIGDVDGVDGLWLGLSVWLTQSAGVAEILANWVATGDAGIDTSSLDYRRFDQQRLTASAGLALASESRGESYRMAHPRKRTAQLPGLAVSPFYVRQQQLDATFGQVGGLERPLWFGDPNTPVTGNVTGNWWEFGTSRRVLEEARAAVNGAAVVDRADVRVAELVGPIDALTRVFAWDSAPALGERVAARLLTAQGGVAGDYTLIRTDADAALALVSSPRDTHLLRAALPESVRVSDVSDAYTALALVGPEAGALLRTVAKVPASFGAFGALGQARIDLVGAPVRAVSSPLVSDDDVLLLFAPQFGLHVWDELAAAGGVAIGDEARAALRIAAGVPEHGTDFGETDTPAEAGLSDSSAARSGHPRVVALELDTPGCPGIVYGQPVRFEGRVVGHVTSFAKDPVSGDGRAIARIEAEVAVTGTPVEVFSLGGPFAARVRTIAQQPGAEQNADQ
ncbi:MAG: FAD-dependent oxidoreductase [Leucobacter sp.]